MCKRIRKYVTYSTVRLAQIDDPLLGGLHYGFMLGIVVYIVLALLGNLSYVLKDIPVGSVRLQIHPPTMPDEHGVPCNPDVWGCDFNFTRPELLTYCSQSGSHGREASVPLPCALWDSNNVVAPVIEGTPFYIATRVIESNQTLVCNQPKAGTACKHTYQFGCHNSFTVDPNCAEDDWATETFYVADLGDYTLLIDHSVRAPKIPTVHATAFQMSGHLERCDGGVVTPRATGEGQDLFTIDTLLAAATRKDGCGIRLDSKSTVEGSKNSARYDGLIVVLNIEYTNLKPWSGVQDTISYTYHLDLLEGTKSKIEQELFVEYPTKRVTRNLHGIKLVVIQTGTLGAFDITTLLVQLTTALTLLTAATTLVDVLAIWMLPQRAAYKKAKIDEVLIKGKSGVFLANPLQSGKQRSNSLANRSV